MLACVCVFVLQNRMYSITVGPSLCHLCLSSGVELKTLCNSKARPLLYVCLCATASVELKTLYEAKPVLYVCVLV